jgi:hypothetical protein
MSGAHAKKEMVTGDKPATSHGKAPSGESDNKKREESPPHVKSHRSGDKKKKMKKVVFHLRLRFFVAFHLRLRHAVCHF